MPGRQHAAAEGTTRGGRAAGGPPGRRARLHGHAVELILGVGGHALALALGGVHPVGACAQ